ncbi:hypothetical protein AVEN_222369-1 [Araneus ventricosus]|uniref:Uncharacterized protein n=1 Tax=Araneus ventricosus TaxID=182803 RepID=A0A4Y2WD88_ARAVE|nr:hypothetical protein AVEN_222369-1 [Araneus ventricosus]
MKTVKFFYEDDEYSMMMSEAKDRVSVKKNEYKQIYLEIKIGFSTFCCLNPQWCVLAGSPGTHAVCVCVIHQNVFLSDSLFNLHHKEAIHQLMDKIVCSRDNRACMLHCYTDCPNNSESLKNYLSDLLKDYDDEEEIQFSQWINDGRMKLQTMTLPVEEFKELVTERIAVNKKFKIVEINLKNDFVRAKQLQDRKTRQNGQVWILNYVFNGILLKGAESSAILQRSESSLHNYVTCVYEENRRNELFSELNKEEGDYTIDFMHPHGPSETFYWPERQDECPVPSQHTLCVIETPEITSHTGRLYKIGQHLRKKLMTAEILSRKVVKNCTSPCYVLKMYDNRKSFNLNI